MLKYIILLVCFLPFKSIAQEVNIDETKVPEYQLPSLLNMAAGDTVLDKNTWEQRRRPEIISFYKDSVYGAVPDMPYKTKFKTTKLLPNFLNGKATLKEIEVAVITKDTIVLNLLLIVPNQDLEHYPVFFGMNFFGNQTIHPDTNIRITNAWVNNNEKLGTYANKAGEASRGARQNRWPIDSIIAHGYALATMHYADVDADFNDYTNGLQSLFYASEQHKPLSNEWGNISAWAFGYSRAVDYLMNDEFIDTNKIIVMGHSRLGKTALWAAANDKRIDMVISNNSGCMGAALTRRLFGETVKRITTKYPYWFAQNFMKYSNNESSMPIDQHMLLALIVPRPIYVASAEDDSWADPRGEYLSLYYASQAFSLYGYSPLACTQQPAINQPLYYENSAYHIRVGKHDVTIFDWLSFMRYADLLYK